MRARIYLYSPRFFFAVQYILAFFFFFFFWVGICTIESSSLLSFRQNHTKEGRSNERWEECSKWIFSHDVFCFCFFQLRRVVQWRGWWRRRQRRKACGSSSSGVNHGCNPSGVCAPVLLCQAHSCVLLLLAIPFLNILFSMLILIPNLSWLWLQS